MLKTAKEVLASKDTKVIVDFAIESNRVAKKAAAEVEETKPFFRDLASATAAKTGEATVNLEGNLGVVQVVFPGPTVGPKTLAKDKKADLLQLEVQLPEAVFNSFFRKVVKVELVDDAAGYQAKLAVLPPAQQNLLKNFIEVADATPRVNIAK